MHPASAIQRVTTGIGDDMNFPITLGLSPDPRLPVHEFVAEFSHIGSGYENLARKEAQSNISEGSRKFVGKGEFILRLAHGFKRYPHPARCLTLDYSYRPSGFGQYV